MANIDAETSATTKRKAKKLSLLKTQIKTQKKLLKQIKILELFLPIQEDSIH